MKVGWVSQTQPTILGATVSSDLDSRRLPHVIHSEIKVMVVNVERRGNWSLPIEGIRCRTSAVFSLIDVAIFVDAHEQRDA